MGRWPQRRSRLSAPFSGCTAFRLQLSPAQALFASGMSCGRRGTCTASFRQGLLLRVNRPPLRGRLSAPLQQMHGVSTAAERCASSPCLRDVVRSQWHLHRTASFRRGRFCLVYIAPPPWRDWERRRLRHRSPHTYAVRHESGAAWLPLPCPTFSQRKAAGVPGRHVVKNIHRCSRHMPRLRFLALSLS